MGEFSRVLGVGRGAFSLKQKVAWRGADSDVPRGAVGKIRGFRDCESVSVCFQDQRFAFPMAELLGGRRVDGFRPGDRVKWKSSDEQIPFGTEGVVAGFNFATGSVAVEMPSGKFGFMPDRLDKIGRGQRGKPEEGEEPINTGCSSRSSSAFPCS